MVTPLPELLHASSLADVRIRLDLAHNKVSIFRATNSGCPVYYKTDSGSCMISSHVRRFADTGVRLEENTHALPEYYLYRFVMPPHTLFRDIFQMHAGALLEIAISADGCAASKQQLSPLPPTDSALTLAQAAAQVRSHLEAHFESYRPASGHSIVLLSGGVDSSLLYKYAERQLGAHRTYATSYPFEERGLDLEQDYALSAAKAFQTEHTQVGLGTRDYLASVIRAIHEAETPIGHLQSALLRHLFAHGISERPALLINGQGSDGIFGLQMHSMVFRARQPLYRALAMQPLKSFVKLLSSITGRGKNLYRSLDNRYLRDAAVENPLNLLWTLNEYGDSSWVESHFGVSRSEIIAERVAFMQAFAGRSIYDLIAVHDYYGDIAFTTASWGKIAAAANCAIVFPLISQDVWETAFKLDWEAKLAQPKQVVRRLAADAGVPDFILDRRKSGFGIKRRDWFAQGGPLEPLVKVAGKVVDVQVMRELQSRPETGMTFWSALSYGIWHRLHIDGESPEALIAELPE